MNIDKYLEEIKKKYNSGNATEHTYRGILEEVIKVYVPEVEIINEPKRQKCGAPDYTIKRKEVQIAHIEAKDIGENLDKVEKSEQLQRYRESLENLILTDYLEFRLYRKGEKIRSIKIASIEKGKLTAEKNSEAVFQDLLQEFCSYKGEPIRSSKELTKSMAGKAKLLKEVIYKSLTLEIEENWDEDIKLRDQLKGQLKAFQEILIHDLKAEDFVDVYAQTIAYGMFAARLHDKTLQDFSRIEAASLIPQSNPFLRKFFQEIAAFESHRELTLIIDSLADVFRLCDIKELLKDFGSITGRKDPFIHFYEDFLAEYNPSSRKNRGVYYTPEAVVNFMVKAVDDLVRAEFDLPEGLADNTKVKVKTIDNKERTEKEEEFHKVQILDPATGTGTFLTEVIKHIYNSSFEGQKGIWNSYVEQHLIPRINGFEVLMASYAMCHLKLDLLLQDTGYQTKANSNRRLNIFLTNTLEEGLKEQISMPFAQALANEGMEANKVKTNTPVMIILGNPPYSVSSMNKNEWIQGLIADYKEGLNEKNINPLSDDYIKFIRNAQHFVDKNGQGIVAMITNNSFLDGVIHRQMRLSLLESFDRIYVYDLHGNSKKKEVSPDGSVDENVFDIMQGVSINIFIRTGKKVKGQLAEVYHHDAWGKRKLKYEELKESTIANTPWTKLDYREPYYFFVPKDFSAEEEYNKGFSVSELFRTYASGVKFRKDNLLIKGHFSSNSVVRMLKDIENLPTEDLLKRYQFSETSDWLLKDKREYFLNPEEKDIIPVQYRPFDIRYTYYPLEKINKIIVRGDSRHNLMRHMLQGDNLGLITCKQQSTFNFQHAFVSKLISDMCSVSLQTKENSYLFPLYIYPVEGLDREPNLNMRIIKEIANKLKLKFTSEKQDRENTFAPIDVLDYIYAVLYIPSYRERYKEFLKIDFPRVPYPQKAETFWRLAAQGKELRELHLLQSNKLSTTYPEAGSNEIESKYPKFVDGKVFINEKQYFGGISEESWNFYIGGYQPAQKWLKDRKERTLQYEDILYYQKVIMALAETGKIMSELENLKYSQS